MQRLIRALCLLSVFAASAASAATVVVHPADLSSGSPCGSGTCTYAYTHPVWFFYNDETDVLDNSLGAMVVGPGTPLTGRGGAQISVTGTQRRNLATYQFTGTMLSAITALKFTTYNPSAGNGGGANRSGYLNFNVDLTGSGSFQGRLSYIPTINTTVVPDTWKEWDTINGGSGLWTYPNRTWPAPIGTSGNSPLTWSQIIAAYPSAKILASDGWLGIRVGEPYSNGYTEDIDNSTFGTSAGTTTFDFEPGPFNVVSPAAPSTCITPAHPCVTVPVSIARTDAVGVRGFTIGVQLSANLALCTGATSDITEGTYLNTVGGTQYFVTSNGSGSYTVDCAILGATSGATASTGNLFNLSLKNVGADGTGTVTITSVALRDPANASILADPGAPASISIDNTAPTAISGLAASQQLTGNPVASTTRINLSWPSTGPGSTVEVFRKGFGNYPEYDDAPGAGSVPTTPVSYPPAGWTAVATVTGATSYVDDGHSIPFSQGFELNDDQWNLLGGQYDATRVPSGTHGITSHSGSWHAEAGQYNLDVDGGSAFTRWGGYSFTFPTGGWTTSIAVYLDCAYAATAGDKRIDFSSSVNDLSGFRRDFVFNMGTEATGFVISAGNNAGRGSANPADPGHSPIHVTTTGWYTLVHRFYDNSGVLACDLQMLSPSNAVLHTWTLSNAADLISTQGGNRYGWFAAQELPFLAIDDSQRSLNAVTDRDFWYYVAYVHDACGNVSNVSNQTNGTLNYHLGDVAAGCAGNNLVNTADISFLGANYGVSIGDPDARACLDVGPTTDHSVNTRPTTDNRIDFEDLIMFAINYGTVSMAVAKGPVTQAEIPAVDELTVDAPHAVRAGETVTASLHLKAAGDIQGLSAKLAWNPAVVAPEAYAAGDLLAGANGVALSPAPGQVDGALLGTRGQGLAGEGEFATVTFRALASGDPGIALGTTLARNTANQPITLGQKAGVVAPSTTALMAIAPNPFHDRSIVSFSLAKRGAVRLAIYSVDGRRVRTLADDTREAGLYRIAWDGRDDRGNAAKPGVFFARLSTGDTHYSRTILRVQ